MNFTNDSIRFNSKYDQKLREDIYKEAAKRKCSVSQVVRDGMRFYIDMFIEKTKKQK